MGDDTSAEWGRQPCSIRAGLSTSLASIALSVFTAACGAGRPHEAEPPPYSVCAEARVTQAQAPFEMSSSPTAVADGTGVGVAWKYEESLSPGQIMIARMEDPASDTPERILAVDARFYQNRPALAWNGTEYALAWFEGINLGDAPRGYVFFLRVATDLTTIGSTVEVAQCPWPVVPDLEWAADAWGIAWDCDEGQRSEVRFARIDPDEPTAVQVVEIAADNEASYSVALASEGEGWGLVWATETAGVPEIHFTRISADGTPTAEDVPVTDPDGTGSIPSALVWSGDAWGLTWRDEDDAQPFFALLDRDGAPISDDVQLTVEVVAQDEADTPRGEPSVPTLAWNGVAWGAAWSAMTTRDFQVHFLALGPGGTPGETLQVTSSEGSPGRPTVVPAGDGFAAVWADGADGIDFANDIYYARLCPDRT